MREQVELYLGQLLTGRSSALKSVALAVLTLVATLWLSLATATQAQTPAKAASGPPLIVGVLVDSGSTEPCYSDGRSEGIELLTKLEAKRINESGGIYGRPLVVQLLNTKGDAETASNHVQSVLSAQNSLGFIGLDNNHMAGQVLSKLGQEVTESGLPFMTGITDRTMFHEMPNIFSTEPPRVLEALPIIAKFSEEMNFERVGFVGRAVTAQSSAFGDGLLARLGFNRLVWYKRIKMQGGLLGAGQLEPLIDELKRKQATGGTKQPQMIVVDLSRDAAGAFMAALTEAKITPALFMTGTTEGIPKAVMSNYPNAIYQLDLDEVPEVYNNSIIDLVTDDNPRFGLFAGDFALDRIPEIIKNRMDGENIKSSVWMVAGTKNSASPGWASGFCKDRPPGVKPSPLAPENLKAIQKAAQISDIVGLFAAAANTAQPGAKIEDLRAKIIEQLGVKYAVGKGAYKGTLQNWSFDPEWRTANRRTFAVIWPQSIGRKQLSPVQFARVKDREEAGKLLREVDTLYADVDLVRLYGVDDNTKSFNADFYLSMRASENATFENLELTNAFIDPRTGGRQVLVETVHAGGPSDVYPAEMRIYRVSGKFRFRPNHANYPFDAQLFSIDIQPKSGKKPFIVQPPPLELRDQELVADGWHQRGQYVGYSAEFVPLVDAFTHEPSVAPFYTASFTWKLKRETTDYFLRVVVPLTFILIVAYFSIFIPQSHLEAIVTIQITALLSAVALYLSLPSLDTETATISDRIFVFDYMMVSFMIMISVLRINQRLSKQIWLDRTLSFLHVVVVPLAVVFMVYSVYQVSLTQA